MNRKLVIATVAIIIIAGTIAAVFVTRQQSDSHYSALAAAISDGKRSETVIAKGLSTVTAPFFITDEFPATYADHIAKLKKSVDAIAANPLVTSDTKVKAAYDAQKQTLQAYVITNEDLLSSVKSYFAVAAACGDMSSKLDSPRSSGTAAAKAQFATDAKQCQDAIKIGDTSPDQQFNEQFFDAYLDNMTFLVDAYRQEAEATNGSPAQKTSRAKIEKLWSEIQGMNSALIDLTRTPDFSGALDAIGKVATTQKAALIR